MRSVGCACFPRRICMPRFGPSWTRIVWWRIPLNTQRPFGSVSFLSSRVGALWMTWQIWWSMVMAVSSLWSWTLVVRLKKVTHSSPWKCRQCWRKDGCHCLFVLECPIDIMAAGTTTSIQSHIMQIIWCHVIIVSSLTRMLLAKTICYPMTMMVYMLIPICAQFHYAYTDSPYANFSGSPQVRIWGLPVCVQGSVSDVSAIFPRVTCWIRIHASLNQNFAILRMHNMRRASNINSHSIISFDHSPFALPFVKSLTPSGIWNWRILL